MYTIGEFSKLAQVSKRQLRFYDQIGLFVPHLIHENGRRLYSATQFAELNRILVLQQLGFSLEQICSLLQENIPLQELQGMLVLKQAESQQRLEAEQNRYRAIASRLKQIERAEAQQPLDVLVKAVPALEVLSIKVSGSLEQGTALFRRLVEQFVEEKGVRYGPFFVRLFANEYEPEHLEGELGRVVVRGRHLAKQEPQLIFGELAAEPIMATFVVNGSAFDLHLGYSAIGEWAQTNGYALAGGSREMFLQLSRQGNSGVIEVQMPMIKAQ